MNIFNLKVFKKYKYNKKILPLLDLYKKENNIEVNYKLAKGFTEETIIVDNKKAYYIKNNNKDNDKIYLYIHGFLYYNNSNIIKKAAYNLSSSLKSDVLVVDYKSMLDNQFPEPLDDILSFYGYLINNYKQENINIFSDYIGGYLSLALLNFLNESSFKKPNKIILLSPYIKILNDDRFNNYIANTPRTSLFINPYNKYLKEDSRILIISNKEHFYLKEIRDIKNNYTNVEEILIDENYQSFLIIDHKNKEYSDIIKKIKQAN